MTESIGYSEVYADDLDTGRDAPTYYVQVNGDYREIEYENQGSWWEPDDYQWGYYTRRTWHQLIPRRLLTTATATRCMSRSLNSKLLRTQ